jgi:hypothetical protein
VCHMPTFPCAILNGGVRAPHPLAGEMKPQCPFGHRLCQDENGGGVDRGRCPEGDDCEVLREEAN